MTIQDALIDKLKLLRLDLDTLTRTLGKAAVDAEGGNLAEVYGGARDWLTEADNAVRLALQTLAPEEEL